MGYMTQAQASGHYAITDAEAVSDVGPHGHMSEAYLSDGVTAAMFSC